MSTQRMPTGTLFIASREDLRTEMREVLGELLAEKKEAAPSWPEEAADLLSVTETMELLHVKSRTTLRELELRGELLPVRIGRRVLYRRSDIESSLKTGVV